MINSWVEKGISVHFFHAAFSAAMKEEETPPFISTVTFPVPFLPLLDVTCRFSIIPYISLHSKICLHTESAQPFISIFLAYFPLAVVERTKLTSSHRHIKQQNEYRQDPLAFSLRLEARKRKNLRNFINTAKFATTISAVEYQVTERCNIVVIIMIY